MKKWLKENDLEPGTGVPIHDLSLGDGNYYLSVFAQALMASGIVAEIDMSLLEAGDDDDDDDGDGDYDRDELEKEVKGNEGAAVAGASSSSSSSSSQPTIAAPQQARSSSMSRMPEHLVSATLLLALFVLHSSLALRMDVFMCCTLAAASDRHKSSRCRNHNGAYHRDAASPEEHSLAARAGCCQEFRSCNER